MKVKKLFDGGERDVARLIAAAQEEFAGEAAIRLEYFEIVDPDNLESQAVIDRRVLVAVAGFAGKTRLIDNILLGP
jgi:pantoate ligase/cytidylate kinase